jgi:hypothetical protein
LRETIHPDIPGRRRVAILSTSSVTGSRVFTQPGSRAGTEKVTQLVVGLAKSASRSWALEPAHRTIAAFDTAMFLLQPVIEIFAVAMPHTVVQIARE